MAADFFHCLMYTTLRFDSSGWSQGMESWLHFLMQPLATWLAWANRANSHKQTLKECCAVGLLILLHLELHAGNVKEHRLVSWRGRGSVEENWSTLADLEPARPACVLDHIDQEMVNNDGLWVESSPPSAFVNKALLEHNHAHSFAYCLWLLLCSNSSDESDCDWDHLVHKVFCRKGLSTPIVNHQCQVSRPRPKELLS